jgi:hypothetical protein
MKLKILSTLALTSAFVLTPLAKADSVIFESHVGDTYTYDLQIDNHGAVFILDGFEITGLSGVTDATLSGALANDFTFGGVAFSSDNVTVGAILGGTGYLLRNPTDIGTLTVTSTSLPGVADFAILDSNGFNYGIVEGPVGNPPAATPEPSSLVLLGSGLLGVAGAARRKLRS